MTDLPANWRRRPLGELLRVQYGKALPAAERLADGPAPLVGSAGRMLAWARGPLAVGPVVVIGRKGSVGSVNFEASGCWPIDTTYFIEIPVAIFEPRFLTHQLASLDLASLDSSTAVPSLRRQDLETVSLAVPPLEEQRRTVDILEDHLSRLDAATGLLEQALTRSESLLRSVLQQGLRGEQSLRREGRGTGADCIPADAALPRSAFLGHERIWPTPADWCWTRIGHAFDVYVGATPSRKEPRLWAGDFPWVSSGEVAFRRITTTNETIARPSNPRRVHPPGTVLLAMIGEGKTRGQAAVLDIEAAHNQNCASIRLEGTRVVPEYVYYFLRERYLITRRAASGGNQPALNKRIIESIPIPIPPLAVQERLVESFISHDEATARLTAEVRRASLEAAGLRRALLAAAFSGRLTGHLSDLDRAEEMAAT